MAKSDHADLTYFMIYRYKLVKNSDRIISYLCSENQCNVDFSFHLRFTLLKTIIEFV